MQDTSLLRAGEFAKLARTTKRTVLWYAEQGILLPYRTDERGYRFYKPSQIIDFESVLLMRKLGFSIPDIKRHLHANASLYSLFEAKRTELARQIADLKRALADTELYYNNIKANGTLVNPVIKQQSLLDVYCIDRTGAYANIKQYVNELKAMIANLPARPTYITIFCDPGYHPKNARMKIAVVREPKMRPLSSKVVSETLPAYRALTFRHTVSVELLSLLWQELDKYRIKNGLKLADDLPFWDLEIYEPHRQGGIVTELHLPIEP